MIEFLLNPSLHCDTKSPAAIVAQSFPNLQPAIVRSLYPGELTLHDGANLKEQAPKPPVVMAFQLPLLLCRCTVDCLLDEDFYILPHGLQRGLRDPRLLVRPELMDDALEQLPGELVRVIFMASHLWFETGGIVLCRSLCTSECWKGLLRRLCGDAVARGRSGVTPQVGDPPEPPSHASPKLRSH